MDVQTMRFTVPDGAVVLPWPESIEPEWLDFAREALEIQMRAIRRRGTSRKAGDIEYMSWLNHAPTPQQ